MAKHASYLSEGLFATMAVPSADDHLPSPLRPITGQDLLRNSIPLRDWSSTFCFLYQMRTPRKFMIILFIIKPCSC